jgi:hypothetical protein
MSMTGKYGGTSDVVTVTAAVEAAITGRLPPDAVYDSGADVQFYVVSDGIVIDVPLTAGSPAKYVLNFARGVLDFNQPFLVDLKAVWEAATEESTTRKAKVRELYAA